MYSAKIICDSISETGKRLTTFEITFPRIVLAEFNTHRMLSRNSASSRAIPFKTQIERVNRDTFIPERFPINCKGMQPEKYVSEENDRKLYNHLAGRWLAARDNAIASALDLYHGIDNYFHLGSTESHEGMENVHKQIVSRLLEPFQWHTVIVTATEFDNFFKLRTNEQAQYEIRRIADLMYEAYHAWDDTTSEVLIDLRGSNWIAVKPKELKIGEWHLPFISDEDNQLIDDMIRPNKNQTPNDYYWQKHLDYKKQISVARCARVSYLTHDGKRDIEKDLELFEKLRTSGHWSPFEHVATPYFFANEFLDKSMQNRRSGNFIGWKQFRKEFADENCTYFRKE